MLFRSVSLCALGENVLLVDADAGLRSLDMVLGMTDKLLFTYADVISGVASLKEASAPHPVVKNLRVLTAPGKLGDFPLAPGKLGTFLARCAVHFTFTIVDCSAGLGADVLSFGTLADRAVLVSTPDATSVRSAQSAFMALAERGQGDCRMVINRLRRRTAESGDSLGIDETIDSSSLQLLGVVPEDPDVSASANRGQVLLLNSAGPAARAYMNIARRLKGQRVRLFQDIKGF